MTLGDYEYNYFSDLTSSLQAIQQVIGPGNTLIAERVSGVLNAINTQLRYQKSVAQKQDVRAVLFEDTDPASPTYGAMCLGTQGFQISDTRTEDGREWDWSTAFTAKGGYADVLVAGILSDKTGTNFWNLDTGEMQLSGTIRQITQSRGLQISEGNIFFLDSNGNSLAVIHVSGTQVLLQGRGDLSGIIRLGGSGNADVQIVPGEGGKALIFGDQMEINATLLKVNGLNSSSGRAEFSDGTYLEFQNGILTGGNTAGGSF